MTHAHGDSSGIRILTLIKKIGGVLRESSWIVVGQILAISGSILSVKMLTNYVTPAVYGEVALWITIGALINQILYGPLHNGLVRFFAIAKEKNDLANYLVATREMTWAVSNFLIFVATVSLIGFYVIAKFEWIWIGLLAVALAIIGGCNGVYGGLQNANRHRFIVAGQQGIESWLRYLFCFVLIKTLGPYATTIMLGYLFAGVVVFFSNLFFLKKIYIGNESPSASTKYWWGKIITYAWPFAIWGVFTWAQLVSDRWALDRFATNDDVGLYAVLYQLGVYPMSLVAGMGMQYLTPIFFQMAGNASDSKKIKKINLLSNIITIATLGITFLISIVAFTFHEFIFEILVSEKYRKISYLLPWVIAASGIFAAGQSIALQLMSQLKSKEQMVIKITTAVFGVFANFVGAYYMGIDGVVAAAVVFSLVYIIWIKYIEIKGRSYELDI